MWFLVKKTGVYMIAIIFISLSLSENWWLMFGTIWRRCGNKSSKNSQKIHFWEPQKTRVNYGLIEKISFICFSSPVSYWNTLNSFNGSCLVTMKWSQFMYDEMKWSFNHNNKGSCWDVVVETIVKGIYHIWKKKKICNRSHFKTDEGEDLIMSQGQMRISYTVKRLLTFNYLYTT